MKFKTEKIVRDITTVIMLNSLYLIITGLAILLTGCEEPQTVYNPPGANGHTTVIDIPQAYRVKNYTKNGSCVYASTACLLNSQGKPGLAEYVRANYSGGANDDDVKAIFDKAGLKYTYGESLDFLRQCHARRLTALVEWPVGHVVNFVGMDESYIYLLDNNRIKHYRQIPIETFVYQWGGWGIALVEKSIPPSLVERGNYGP